MKKCHGNTKKRRFSVLQIGKKNFQKTVFDTLMAMRIRICRQKIRLVSDGILEKEREPGIGKLGWHGNFDMGFERNTDYDEITKNSEKPLFSDLSGSGDRNFLLFYFFQIPGSVTFLGITILQLCAKIQKIPMVQSREKLVTNE